MKRVIAVGILHLVSVFLETTKRTEPSYPVRGIKHGVEGVAFQAVPSLCRTSTSWELHYT